jgi:hypothetical protein
MDTTVRTTTSGTTTFRRRFGAVSLVAAPLLFAAAELLYPTSGNDPAGELPIAAAHHGQLLVAITCGLLAAILFIPAFFALMNPVRGRGTALAHVGGGLALLGNAVSGLAMAGVQYIFYEASAPGVDRHAVATFVGQATRDPIGAPLVFGHMVFVLGILLLAIGLFRGGVGPRWAAVCLGLGPMLDAILGSAGLENTATGTLVATVLSDAVFIAGAVGLAWWHATTSNSAWEGVDVGPGASASRRPVGATV